MKRLFTLTLILSLGYSLAFAQRINEIHYDNDGADTGEFVEIFIANPQPAVGDLSQYEIYLYNGINGAFYSSTNLGNATDVMTACDAGGCYYVWNETGIQNGTPDGVALFGPGGLIEFLSYEGTFTATNGPANGVTSTDIGASESGSTPVGSSLQNDGFGTWMLINPNTAGAVNSNNLPVELSSWNATYRDKQVALNWTTSLEIENDHFLVQHSPDGTEFKTLEKIAGAGTTYETQTYGYDHLSPVIGLNYYRLVQVDLDGSSSVTEVKRVRIEAATTTSIYPNPAVDRITVSGAENATYRIYDQAGSLILQSSDNPTLDVSSLTPGTYFLEVTMGYRTERHVFIRN